MFAGYCNAGKLWIIYKDDGFMHTLDTVHAGLLTDMAAELGADSPILAEVVGHLRAEHLASQQQMDVGKDTGPRSIAAEPAGVPAAQVTQPQAPLSGTAVSNQFVGAVTIACNPGDIPVPWPVSVSMLAAAPSSALGLGLPTMSGPSQTLQQLMPAVWQHQDHRNEARQVSGAALGVPPQIPAAGILQTSHAPIPGPDTRPTTSQALHPHPTHGQDGQDIDVDELIALCLGD